MSEEAMGEDFLIPFGQAKVEKEGTDLTLVAYSKAVQLSIEAAKELEKIGVNAEVGSQGPQPSSQTGFR